MSELRDTRQRCRFCGELRKTQRGGLLKHERSCPANPDRPPALFPGALCCVRCRTELPSPRRLALHVEHAHPGEPLRRVAAPPEPRPAPAAPPVEPPAIVIRSLTAPLPALPSCGCGRPFAVDPVDPDRRCLYCSGAYARATGYAVAAD